jgi:hypothetical protein
MFGFTSSIPARLDSAPTGSAFLTSHMNSYYSTLESDAITEILTGNVPTFWRDFSPINISGLTYLVSPDYLCLGSDDDYIRMPLSGTGAQLIASAFHCSLPTVKMVNDIYAQSTNKLVPKPFGPPYDSSMMSAGRIQWMNDQVNKQLASKDRFALSEGHKKNVVLTNKLSPNNPQKRVAIYGWFNADGSVIQNLNPSTHEISYFDYSHGIRLVADLCTYNGNVVKLSDAFKQYPHLLSNEGELTFLKY